MSQVGIDFWWTFFVGTTIVLTLGITLVIMVMLHQRTKYKLEMEKCLLIKKSEQKYNDLFNNVSDIIYIHSLDGIIIEINQTVFRLLGPDVKDVIGSSIFDLFPQKYHTQVREYIGRLGGENSGEQIGIFSVLSRSGSRLHLFEYKSSVIHKDGRAVAVRGVARNVTERVESERSLRKAKNRMERLLLQSRIVQEKLSQLSRESIQMLEEERHTISRELHDEVGQLLTAIKVNLELMKKAQSDNNGEIKRMIGDTENIVGEVFNRVHHFLHELRPIALDEVGLLGTINRFADDFSRRTDIKVIIEDDELLEQLDPEQKISIYRIIQESFTNIVKHSQANKVVLSMIPDGQHIILEIRDNGIGFDDEEKRRKNIHEEKRLGLLGMEERTKLARGEFKIISEKGSGTTVSVRLPIKNKENNKYINSVSEE